MTLFLLYPKACYQTVTEFARRHSGVSDNGEDKRTPAGNGWAVHRSVKQKIKIKGKKARLSSNRNNAHKFSVYGHVQLVCYASVNSTARSVLLFLFIELHDLHELYKFATPCGISEEGATAAVGFVEPLPSGVANPKIGPIAQL